MSYYITSLLVMCNIQKNIYCDINNDGMICLYHIKKTKLCGKNMKSWHVQIGSVRTVYMHMNCLQLLQCNKHVPINICTCIVYPDIYHFDTLDQREMLINHYLYNRHPKSLWLWVSVYMQVLTNAKYFLT